MRNAEGYQPSCVIAGAGRRLGLALAKRFAREGFVAYMLLRHPERIGALRADERARRQSIVAMQCDVGDPESVVAALQEIHERQGGCDVLIYNAFAPSSGRATDLNPETMLSDFRVNVAGALSFVRLTIAEMRETGGALLFSGCGLGQTPDADRASLSVGKAALRAFVECLADDVEREGVRVGMVTINGTMPTKAKELRVIANLYWDLFALGELSQKRELLYGT